jgi:NACalpha-BTF3-like transcription factor
MNQMMKKLGINVKEIENVQKVVIQTDTNDYIYSLLGDI